MADYRLIMTLLVQQRPHRQIEVMAGCTHRAIARGPGGRSRRSGGAHPRRSKHSRRGPGPTLRGWQEGRFGGFRTRGRRQGGGGTCGAQEAAVEGALGAVLDVWDVPGARYYGYDRFCEIVTEHVRTHDLTAAIAHLPGHTMQVDWAGTRMHLTDPVSRRTTPVSVFVASLPYSGLVFAFGSLDEKQPARLDVTGGRSSTSVASRW